MNLLAAGREDRPDPAEIPYTVPIRGPVGGDASALGIGRPSSVDVRDWQQLEAHVALSLAAGAVDGRLQHAVHTVVRAMRQARTPWDSIYLALSSAFGPEQSPMQPTRHGMEQHPTPGAALVAHMHCWADCERLEELERGE